MSELDLLISEVFGPTLQGEGASAGQRAAFIRLGACNLHCTWCDTPYTWDGGRYDLRAELGRVPTDQIVSKVRDMAVPLVVVSGGEPLLQQRFAAFHALVVALGQLGMRVEFETNGTLAPKHWLVGNSHVRFNVSPKLTHNGDPENLRIRPEALYEFAKLADMGRASFKFVVRHGTDAEVDEDMGQVAEFAARFVIPASAVWLMPEGTEPDVVLRGTRRLAQEAIQNEWNLTTRLHTLIWGSERGR